MILVDYSQTVIASFFAEAGGPASVGNDIDLTRHLVLNTLRSYNHKYKNSFGQLIVCADGQNSWRKEVFPHYKAGRSKSRKAQKDVDWKALFDALSQIFDEIRDLNLYPTIRVPHAEGDDVIATLTKWSFKEKGTSEKTLIVSSDKDFIQLQKYGNVSQFSPTKKGLLKDEKSPTDFLIEHIIKGDSSDGCPNIFSDDDVFVNDAKRQSPATKKKVDAFMDFVYNGGDGEAKATALPPEEWRRNYDRNKRLIDLDMIPKEIEEKIVAQWDEVRDVPPSQKAFMDYLVQHRLKLLLGSIDEFF